MRYYIIAGEASGDLHGSNLMKGLKKHDSNAEFYVWGGNLMEANGGVLRKHYRDLAFMGFTEVITHLPEILNNLKFCKNDILSLKPDVLILIDYPGFNMRIAEFAHAHGILVYYYISPQVWAWKAGRVKKLKKWVNEMFVILPFEKEFYARYNMDVTFEGHPLLDAILQFREDNSLEIQKTNLIALLPGSRKQEVTKMLPEMLAASRNFPDAQLVIAAAPSLPSSLFEELCKGYAIEIVYGKTYEILSQAKVAMVTSGTATLETALFKVPFVVCYKGSSVSHWLAKKLIKVKYISLVNLILDKPVVKELIQHDLTSLNLTSELNKLWADGDYRTNMLYEFDNLINTLGGSGASERVAKLMIERLKK
jgi:lipid-A-disaccharide synthase